MSLPVIDKDRLAMENIDTPACACSHADRGDALHLYINGGVLQQFGNAPFENYMLSL